MASMRPVVLLIRKVFNLDCENLPFASPALQWRTLVSRYLLFMLFPLRGLRLKARPLFSAITLMLAAGCQNDPTPIDPSELSLRALSGDQQLTEMRNKAALWAASYQTQQNFRKTNSSSVEVMEEVVVTASSVASSTASSVTNNQIQGVDEGDIVKRINNQLIVLRRGRIFTYQSTER